MTPEARGGLALLGAEPLVAGGGGALGVAELVALQEAGEAGGAGVGAGGGGDVAVQAGQLQGDPGLAVLNGGEGPVGAGHVAGPFERVGLV